MSHCQRQLKMVINGPRGSSEPSPEVTLRILRQLFLAFACLVMCTGLCARQSVGIVSQTNASAAGEGKNTVQGKVVQDPGGQGIRKVKVTLAPAFAPSHGPYQTTTDEAGQFKIENVGPGTYRVLLERPGFALDTKAQRTITVSESQNTKDLVCPC